MKALRVVTGFVLVVALLIVSVLPALAVEAETVVLKSAQLYPVMTTEEWKEMSRQDRLAACQIVENELDKMSTEDLLQHVLNYPFMIDIYAFSTYEMGFDHVCEEFEAISVLVNRDDYSEALIRTYASVPVETSKSVRNSNFYQNIWDLGILEILIAQPEMTQNLSNSEINTLTSIAQAKYDEKSNALSVYSGSVLSFANALNEQPDSSVSRAVSYPRTPRGNAVGYTNTSSYADWSAEEKELLDAQALSAYPTATLLRSASIKYNCHSYAWHSRSSSNHYWIPDPTEYMRDGSYYSTSRQIGTIAYWYTTFNNTIIPIHSGIVDEHMQSGVYIGAISKWGNSGLFNHRFDDCPYSGTITYWTQS